LPETASIRPVLRKSVTIERDCVMEKIVAHLFVRVWILVIVLDSLRYHGSMGPVWY